MTNDVKARGQLFICGKAIDFEAHIPELLKMGCVKESAEPEAGYVLDHELKSACVNRFVKRELYEKPPSADLFKQLTNSIKKTQGLLRRLSQWRKMDWNIYLNGEGTVMILTLKRKGGLPDQAVPLGHPVIIDRQRVLDELLREIDDMKPTRKQGNQEELDKYVIVARAVSFLQRYSSEKLTTYFDGACVKFCRRFYEVVTGVTLGPSGLVKQIRYELRRPKIKNPNLEKKLMLAWSERRSDTNLEGPRLKTQMSKKN